MPRYHVTYYYLATGMEGIADERDYGEIDAATPDDAIKKMCAREGITNWGLSAKKVKEPVTFQPATAEVLHYEPIPLRCYELRFTHDDGYYALGFFASLQSLRNYVATRDGKDTNNGGPIAECMDDGEELDVVEHKLGEVNSCGDGGVVVLRLIRRSQLLDPEDELDEPYVWTTEEVKP